MFITTIERKKFNFEVIAKTGEIVKVITVIAVSFNRAIGMARNVAGKSGFGNSNEYACCLVK